MAGGNGQQPFTVTTPPEVRQRLRALAERAAAAGVLPEYIADLRSLDENLRYSPREWGDRLKTYPHARLRYYRRLTRFLLVLYAVHLDRPIVFVRDILLRPDRPFGQAEGA
jgi:hypothetical protein